jgi:hypothetical protein
LNAGHSGRGHHVCDLYNDLHDQALKILTANNSVQGIVTLAGILEGDKESVRGADQRFGLIGGELAFERFAPSRCQLSGFRSKLPLNRPRNVMIDNVRDNLTDKSHFVFPACSLTKV